MYEVTWLDPGQQRELTSEAALFDAQGQGWVEITPTNGEGNSLPNTHVHGII